MFCETEHINLHAYDGVETLHRFSEESFYNYCHDKLQTCQKHIAFAKEVLQFQRRLNVLEFASGNSKLLYSMENNELLESGIGVEISKSRFEFAEKFKKKFGFHRVSNINDDVCNFYTKSNSFDLIVGVDVALNLIAPVIQERIKNLIDTFYRALSDDGVLLLELSSFDQYMKILDVMPTLNEWQEFSTSDPFSYCLSIITKKTSRSFMWEKKFISRLDNSESCFSHEIMIFKKKHIQDLLFKAGFTEVRFYDYYQTPGDCDQDEYIVAAKK